jgi:hypothetical protein
MRYSLQPWRRLIKAVGKVLNYCTTKVEPVLTTGDEATKLLGCMSAKRKICFGGKFVFSSF